jgi:hypothetical protein
MIVKLKNAHIELDHVDTKIMLRGTFRYHGKGRYIGTESELLMQIYPKNIIQISTPEITVTTKVTSENLRIIKRNLTISNRRRPKSNPMIEIGGKTRRAKSGSR